MKSPYLKIINWDEFQHYKDRDPKWIKVYRNITDNYEFSQLPDFAKGHLLGLWLLAAKLDNKIPADVKWIGTRINSTVKIDLELLERSGFIAPYQMIQNDTEDVEYSSDDASLEREREEEKRREEKKRGRFVKPSLSDISSYCLEIGFKQDGQVFLDYYEANGWLVGKNKMKDWKATVRNWQHRSNEPAEAPKRPKDPRIEFERILNEIIIDAGRSSDVDGYWKTVWDKYKDTPKLNGKHVVNAARNHIKDQNDR